MVSRDVDPLGLSSLFQSLAVELRIEIFSQVLLPFPRITASEGPLRLCHVCRAWRTLAIDTSELWTSFTISGRTSIDAVLLFLVHSKEHPLSIRVVDVEDAMFIGLANILRVHLPRTRRLDLSLHTRHALILFSISFPNFNALQQLHFTSTTSSNALLSVFDIHSLQVPWGQLTSLQLSLDHGELPTLDDCYTILSGCVSLETCVLKSAYSSLSRRPTSPFSLQLLRTFQLTLLGQEMTLNGQGEIPGIGLAKFMSAISATQLRSLCIEWLVDGISTRMPWEKDCVDLFLDGFQSVSGRLKQLQLAYLPLSDMDLLKALQDTPYIVELSIKFSLAGRSIDALTDVFLIALTVMPRRHTILPLLVSAMFQCSGDSYDNATMLELVHSRRAPSSTAVMLKSFRLITMQSVSTAFSQAITNWVDQGLETRVDVVTLF